MGEVVEGCVELGEPEGVGEDVDCKGGVLDGGAAYGGCVGDGV